MSAATYFKLASGERGVYDTGTQAFVFTAIIEGDSSPMAQMAVLMRSSIGKKFLMGVTGLGISGFVLTHMSGNLLLLVSAEKYNLYSHALITNPLLPVAEIGLVAMFLAHIGLAIKLTKENRAARPQAYGVSAKGAKATCAASRTMILSGLVLLSFLIIHLKSFKYGPHYEATYNGVVVRDLYKLVFEMFQKPAYSGFYIVSLVLLGMHLSHGFKASLQSLGVFSSKNPLAARLGYAFAALVTIGFILQPVVLYMKAAQ